MPGAKTAPKESSVGRGLLLLIWMLFWPVSMLVGTPHEATQDIPPFRLLRAVGVAVLIAGLLVLCAILLT